jgi:hypothetical protein
MKEWEKAERKVKRLSRGKTTPGSGNKRIKGDIINPNMMAEVKSTGKNFIAVESEWFLKLLRECPMEKEPVLVLVFGSGEVVVYSLDLMEGKPEKASWKVMRVTTDSAPKKIVVDTTEWRRWGQDYLVQTRGD